MKRRSRLWQIIRMEFRLTAANKAFIVLTILGPFLIFAVTVLPTAISSRGGMGRSLRSEGRGGQRRRRFPRGHPPRARAATASA